MKSLKMQQEIIKAAEARDGWKHKPFNYPYFVADGRVWICPEANWMIGIPEKQFYFESVNKKTHMNF